MIQVILVWIEDEGDCRVWLVELHVELGKPAVRPDTHAVSHCIGVSLMSVYPLAIVFWEDKEPISVKGLCQSPEKLIYIQSTSWMDLWQHDILSTLWGISYLMVALSCVINSPPISQPFQGDLLTSLHAEELLCKPCMSYRESWWFALWPCTWARNFSLPQIPPWTSTNRQLR